MSDEKTRYQWIKGDDLGSVETVTDNSTDFWVFESGRRCNHKLLDEFMIPIFDEADILPLATIEKEVKKLKDKPKKKRPQVVKKITSKPKSTPIKKVDSPIIALLEKAKVSKTKLNTRIEMDLPSKNFIEVLQDSWDEDVIDILSKHIVSKIEDPKKFLSEKIKISLKDWFSKK